MAISGTKGLKQGSVTAGVTHLQCIWQVCLGSFLYKGINLQANMLS